MPRDRVTTDGKVGSGACEVCGGVAEQVTDGRANEGGKRRKEGRRIENLRCTNST